ncbi:hypothetical protein Dimus_034716 [Dionaea muscipula]
MEFWGLEVKAGESIKVDPREGMILHVSQACLGELKKEKNTEHVLVYASKGGKKFLLGSLSADKFPHLSFDLVFEDEFELSHNWKNGSVHFAGYRSIIASTSEGEEDEESSDEELEEKVPLNNVDNGKLETKQGKPASDEGKTVASKQKVKIAEPIKKDPKENEDSDDDESDEADDSDEDVDESSSEASDDDGDDDSDEDEEMEEDTPKKADLGKKRHVEAAAKTPASNKKAKLVTPQKTDGKKASGHVATPHPSKQAGKATADKPKQQQTPKSGGSFTCGSCSKTFNSEVGLQSHSKAKHGK